MNSLKKKKKGRGKKYQPHLGYQVTGLSTGRSKREKSWHQDDQDDQNKYVRLILQYVDCVIGLRD